VASWSPDAADELIDLRTHDHVSAPPGVPVRCVDLASRALRLSHLTQVAMADHGGALAAGQVEQRRVVLEELQRAARQGLVAACSPDGWPPDNLQAR
ncbi:MAG: hypothetical protein L0H31_03190, partial [Nocardioidaceae bacterium]|nr:hypothetical protein [Nocardioidaceae bacterium]